MEKHINAEMLILARESEGISQRALSELTGISQGRLSRYESGLAKVPGDHLNAIAEHLKYPLEFFYIQERLYNASCMYHRKKKSLTVTEEKRIHAQVNKLRIRAVRLLRDAEVESANRFHRLDMEKFGSPEDAAAGLRRLWQLPTGPIRNVIGTLERAGGIVFRCPFGSSRVDGISQWPLDDANTPPVFFISADIPGDRMRFTLCHELAHVSLHHLPTDDPEAEADRFASEFLLPARELRDDLRGMTLQKAAALKSYWKVSMGAIIRRSYDLGGIELRQYRYLNMQLSQRGYRRCEPIPIPPEEPRLLREIIAVHRTSHRRSLADLSRLLGMHEDEFRAEYWNDLTAGIRLAM